MNESDGIANSKGFGVLRGFERFGKSCCLKGQHRQGAVFAANNAYLRNVVAYTFFLPVEDNNVMSIICLSRSWQSVFSVPRVTY